MSEAVSELVPETTASPASFFLSWATPNSNPSKNADHVCSTDCGFSHHCAYFSSNKSALSRAETVEFMCLIINASEVSEIQLALGAQALVKGLAGLRQSLQNEIIPPPSTE